MVAGVYDNTLHVMQVQVEMTATAVTNRPVPAEMTLYPVAQVVEPATPQDADADQSGSDDNTSTKHEGNAN